MSSPLLSYRQRNHLTQEELADILGVSRALISLIETGARPITPENARDWEPLLGMPRKQLCPEIFKAA